MKNTYFFAVDLGATSGRTIVGHLDQDKLELRQLTRFPNNIIQVSGHFYWDILALYNEIIKGLKIVAEEKIPIESIGIDTWGVDFVFMIHILSEHQKHFSRLFHVRKYTNKRVFKS